MNSRLRIVVSGLIAQYPLGGVAWDYGQYVLGLRRMGHDVFYLEDTGQWPYDPQAGETAQDPSFSLEYLSAVMESFGMEDRWAYRFPHESRWFGLPDARRQEVLITADLLINVSGALRAPEDHAGGPVLAYIDSDPVFTQVKLARGQEDFRRMVAAHDVHFSFGECLGEGIGCAEDAPSNAVPPTDFRWLPTRQPVVLEAWETDLEPRDAFTTVMNWTSYNPVEFEGRSYGQKDVEFRKYLDLPDAVAPTTLELAVAEGKTSSTPYELLRHKGWEVVDPQQVCPDPESYRSYIQTSRAEWSVAKNGYVAGRPGWFSCRSACYLAAGRPVVVQDTGFGEILPTGEGLLGFRTPEEAAKGIREVQADYTAHSRAAREIAGEYFDAKGVLESLIERCGAGGSSPRTGSQTG